MTEFYIDIYFTYQVICKLMKQISPSVEFLLLLAKFEAIVSRRLDARLGGIGFTEFQILYHLSNAEDEKMRRVDLAEQIGLTASGITRLLLPMEKIGLVKKQTDSSDARVSYVSLAKGGKQKLVEGMERAELFVEDVLPGLDAKKVQDLSKVLGLLA